MKTNMTTATLLVVLCCFHVASGVTHTLHSFLTGTSGNPNFPEFIAVAVVDGQQTVHYDSFTKKAVPKADWMAAALDSEYWKGQTEILVGEEAVFKNNIVVAKSRFNQTEGVHTLQLMYGCELDDDSGDISGLFQHGYDGEDFLSRDKKDMVWVAAVPEAFQIKEKFNKDKAEIEAWRNYFSKQCIDWLKKYLQYGSSTLGRTVPPKVTLLQKNSSVVCHSTGFYPDGVMITWKRDGVDMHEDVDTGETLPNEDGTFQKRAELTVSLEGRKKGNFTCEVAHKSGKTLVVFVEDGNAPIGIIIGVLAVVVLIGVVVTIVMMKKKNGYKETAHSDADSDLSNPNAREELSVVTAKLEE